MLRKFFLLIIVLVALTISAQDINAFVEMPRATQYADSDSGIVLEDDTVKTSEKVVAGSVLVITMIFFFVFLAKYERSHDRHD